jgi:hypothetical protein
MELLCNAERIRILLNWSTHVKKIQGASGICRVMIWLTLCKFDGILTTTTEIPKQVSASRLGGE